MRVAIRHLIDDTHPSERVSEDALMVERQPPRLESLAYGHPKRGRGVVTAGDGQRFTCDRKVRHAHDLTARVTPTGRPVHPEQLKTTGEIVNACFFSEFSTRRLFSHLARLDETARQRPTTTIRVVAAFNEQHAEVTAECGPVCAASALRGLAAALRRVVCARDRSAAARSTLTVTLRRGQCHHIGSNQEWGWGARHVR